MQAEGFDMRWSLLVLAVIGMIVSSLALREHYREYGDSPCSINERWDCGIVNQSPIAGYLLMGVLAFRRAYRLLLPTALAGLSFSLYLAHVEAHILGVWCIYCVASLAVISIISLLALALTIAQFARKRRSVAS
jgi:vitamin-K-epoxide reductase (warfarin-sensitive)